MSKERMPAYGGQAVIEGVMMRGRKSVAMAVRAPDNSIVVFQEKLPTIYKSKIFKIPFIRGLIGLWDAIGLGMRYLTQAANVQTGEDEKLEGFPLFITMSISILIGIIFFFVAPVGLASLLQTVFSLNNGWINLIEGLLRLLILILYLLIIRRIPEIKRTFAYHGAEHKTINAFESGVSLTPESVVKQSVEHPRCGTSFILTLVVISVIVFSFLPPMEIYWRILSRLLLIPLVAGISYEYIRLLSSHMDSKFIRFLFKPNLSLQKLTTFEPSLEMLEVSIKAFDTMYKMETSVLDN
jgi:uncharacterized protein YqhQ